MRSMVYIPSLRWNIIEFGGKGWFSSRPKNCKDCRLTFSSIRGTKSCRLTHILTVTVSSRVVPEPSEDKSKVRYVGFIAFSTTSLIYIGSSCPSQCKVKKLSAMRLSLTSSSFFCLMAGLAPTQFELDLLVLVGRRSPDDCA